MIARLALPLAFAVAAGCAAAPLVGKSTARDDATPAPEDTAPTQRIPPHGIPGCSGDLYGMVGNGHGRADVHWVDCRTGDRIEVADKEFEAWFARRRGHVAAPASASPAVAPPVVATPATMGPQAAPNPGPSGPPPPEATAPTDGDAGAAAPADTR